MLGYFPPILPEELFISALARAKDIIVPAQSHATFRGTIIGAGKSFGWTLPNNGRAIQNAFLPLCRPTDDAIVDGSIYHILNPFLEMDASMALKESLFQGGIGSRNLFSYHPLRYCVQCAREDHERERPQHWRVLHNHPAVKCCDLHGLRLTESRAMPSRNNLYLAEDWIDLDMASEPAAPIEAKIAKDIRWIYDQMSALRIDRPALTTILAIEVRRRFHKRISHQRLHAELAATYGVAYRHAFPTGINLRKGRGLGCLPLDAWLMIMHFVGHELPEFLAKVREVDLNNTRDIRIQSAMADVAQLQREQAGMARGEIERARPYSARFLRKCAPKQYVAVIPMKQCYRSNLKDWSFLDAQYHDAAKTLMGGSMITCLSQSELMKAAGVRGLSRNRHKLPLTASYVSSITFKRRNPSQTHRWEGPAQAMAFARTRLAELRDHHRNLSATEFRGYAPDAYRIILKFAPDELPARSSMNWLERDREMKDRLEQILPGLELDVRCSKRHLMLALNESEQLMGYAADKLPQFSLFVRTVIGRAREERKLRRVAKPPQDTITSRLGRAVNWSFRDSEYVQTIISKKDDLNPIQRSSFTRILKAVGISHFVLNLAKGRLPQTEALLATISQPYDLLAAKRLKLSQLVRENPGLGREALRLLDRTTVDGVLAADREFYARAMPRSLRQTSAVSEQV